MVNLHIYAHNHHFMSSQYYFCIYSIKP